MPCKPATVPAAVNLRSLSSKSKIATQKSLDSLSGKALQNGMSQKTCLDALIYTCGISGSSQIENKQLSFIWYNSYMPVCVD